MPVPKYYEMYKPILFSLKDGKLHSLKELKAAVRDYFNLTNEDMAELLPSKQQTYFENRVGWAKTFLKKAGLIESPIRAMFLLTEDGKETVAKNPDTIDDKYLLQYEKFKPFYYSLSSNKKQQTSPNNVKEMDKTPEDIINEAYSEIHKRLSSDLMEEILKLSPVAFERFVLDLLYKMGYGAFEGSSQTTPRTNDKGIDGIIMEDKLGFNLIYLQVKRWNTNNVVGRKELQAFLGAIAGKGGTGLFVTTSKFTSEAVEYAESQHIILIDGQKLVDYMIEHNFGVSTKTVYKLKSIDTDLFDEYDYE